MQSKTFSTLCSIEHLTRAWEDVKAKKAGGGVDGETIATFEVNLERNLQTIREELMAGKWEPYPYLRIEIPKKITQKRQIGMLTVKDKIVQQAIRLLFEPSCEKMFLPCSFGYRPGKGAVSAINKVKSLCGKPHNRFLLRLDIDDYFNHINHEKLEKRIRGISQDPELVRLIMLCVKMGAVTKNLSWKESEEGVHQGAVLSPCLANLYLHSFDVFVTSKNRSYVRYADDFVIFCQTREEAEELLKKTEGFLQEKLDLALNPPIISEVKDGFEFLGIIIGKGPLQLSPAKKEALIGHIESFQLTPGGMSRQAMKKWQGIQAYYGKLLSQEVLQELDQALYTVLKTLIAENHKEFPSKSVIEMALKDIHFLTLSFREHEAAIKENLVSEYLEKKKATGQTREMQQNRKVVLKRKHEYRKLEEANAELIVTRPGIAIGLAKNRVTLKANGVVVTSVPTGNLKHISIFSEGVSLSSNVIRFSLENKIPLDIYSGKGKHIGSFLSTNSFQCEMWQQQVLCPQEKRNRLGATLIEGKLTNQLNLIKYFHKYHKSRTEEYQTLVEEMEAQVKAYKHFMKEIPYESAICVEKIMAYESQGALKYWAYIRSLLEDDAVGFEGRTGKGATDLVNCMLNYGYAILYSRVWQALLKAQLNPYDSVIHVRQKGKPTFVYDVVELFRAQAVDRVVFALVQKREPVEVKDGMLSDSGKRLLAKNITERLQKREKYRGEEKSLMQIIYSQVQEIAAFITSGERYLPYKAKW